MSDVHASVLSTSPTPPPSTEWWLWCPIRKALEPLLSAERMVHVRAQCKEMWALNIRHSLLGTCNSGRWAINTMYICFSLRYIRFSKVCFHSSPWFSQPMTHHHGLEKSCRVWNFHPICRLKIFHQGTIFPWKNSFRMFLERSFVHHPVWLIGYGLLEL